MRKLFILVISLGFALSPILANAWGQNGHRIVGQIAFNHLSRKAKKNIRKILGTETPAIAATWADFIKSDHQFDHMYNWHFVNMPSGWPETKVYQYLDTLKQANVYNKSLELMAKLKDKRIENHQKILPLKALIHMIGDLMQPMHVGHAEDLGGNKINVQWFNTPSNLHAVWDEKLLESENLSYTEFTEMIDHPTKEQKKKLQAGSINSWVYDSYQSASKLYESTQPDQKLSYRYIYDYSSVLHEQLLKGGLRLAKVLNDIFG